MPTRTLTDAFVRSVKCEPGLNVREYRDASLEGLELRTWASGSKSWRLHYTRRSDGRRRVVGLGSYPAVSLKVARIKAKRLQAEIEDDSISADPAATKQQRRVAETFAELAEDWIAQHGIPNKSPASLKDDRSMLALHVLPVIGAMKANEITKRQVISLLDNVKAKQDLRRKKRNGRRLTHRPNRVFALVRSIFRWALGRDAVKIDPTAGVPTPIASERARERELSPNEIRTLWVALDSASIARERWKRDPTTIPMRRATALAMMLALATGQRIGEVVGIPLSELDLNDIAPVWKIPGRRAKNREPHRVPLSPLAMRIIAEARTLAGESEWLFPSPTGRGPIDRHAPTKELERSRQAIGLVDFRIHDLRRTSATRMEEMGVPPHVISHILNHVSVSKASVTKKVYSRYTYEKEKREALNAWGMRLEKIVAGVDVANVALIAIKQLTPHGTHGL